MACEMCGKTGPTRPSKIEGTTMSVCQACSKFGVSVEQPKKFFKKQSYFKEESNEIINQNFSKLIHQGRENKGLTQAKLAVKIAEKESVIQHLESGSLKPSMQLAKKLETSLGIKLIDTYKQEKIEIKKTSSDGMTIGDILKSKLGKN